MPYRYANKSLAKRVRALEKATDKKKKGFFLYNRNSLVFGVLYNIGASGDHMLGDINIAGAGTTGRVGNDIALHGMRMTLLVTNRAVQASAYTTDNTNDGMWFRIMIVRKEDDLVADGAEYHAGYGDAQVFGFYGSNIVTLIGTPNAKGSRVIWQRTVKIGGLGDRNDAGCKLLDYYINFKGKRFQWEEEAGTNSQKIDPNYRILFWAQTDNGSVTDLYSVSTHRIVYYSG